MFRFVIASLLIALLWVLFAEDFVASAQNRQAPPPVTIALPLQKQITEWDEFTGRFEAIKFVDVRARVSGFLESVKFKSGDFVEKGDLLFVLDKEPFQIAVDLAKAQLQQAQAQLDLAVSELDRAKPLAETRTLTTREFETRLAQQREAEARVKEAHAGVRQAELNLKWTEVRAPIAGRISDSRVDAGNLITGAMANSTPLTVIVSLTPIHFVFEGSEQDYLKYTRLDRGGKRPSSRETANPVAVKLADEEEFVHKGTMDFVDNVIDTQSGTIRARAIFANEDKFLLPGLFGRLRLFGGTSKALLVPDSAIASDQARKIVMSVGDDGTVVPKVVSLGPIIDGLRVVRSGLQPDDHIVINGMQRARPGQKVTPEEGEIVAN